MDPRPDEDDGAVPGDAPVETPQADPRTPGAPDPGSNGPTDATEDETVSEQIGDAFA